MRFALALVAGAALALAASPARPQDPVSRLDQVAARRSGAPSAPAGAHAAHSSPLQQQIVAVVDSVRTEADRLRAAAADPATLAADLDALQRHRRLRILQIQAAHAERAGRPALAARIREDIARLSADGN